MRLVAIDEQSVRVDRLMFDNLRLAVKRAVRLSSEHLWASCYCHPLMLAIGLWIRLDSPGPVLFRQLRRGYRGKLCSGAQIPDNDRRRRTEASNIWRITTNPLVASCSSSVTIPESPGWVRYLRRHSLDELPQLINVLWGEIDLGRPSASPSFATASCFLATNPHAYHRRLHVMPGLTGPWQVGGRSEVNYERMVELDLEYVENWSLISRLRHHLQDLSSWYCSAEALTE